MNSLLSLRMPYPQFHCYNEGIPNRPKDLLKHVLPAQTVMSETDVTWTRRLSEAKQSELLQLHPLSNTSVTHSSGNRYYQMEEIMTHPIFFIALAILTNPLDQLATLKHLDAEQTTTGKLKSYQEIIKERGLRWILFKGGLGRVGYFLSAGYIYSFAAQGKEDPLSIAKASVVEGALTFPLWRNYKYTQEGEKNILASIKKTAACWASPKLTSSFVVGAVINNVASLMFADNGSDYLKQHITENKYVCAASWILLYTFFSASVLTVSRAASMGTNVQLKNTISGFTASSLRDFCTGVQMYALLKVLPEIKPDAKQTDSKTDI